MTARDASPLAGKTVNIRADVLDPPNQKIAGQEYVVEDWWINVYGRSWMVSEGNMAAIQYGMRAGFSGLPTDDEVLYGKVDGIGHLVHVSEIEASA